MSELRLYLVAAVAYIALGVAFPDVLLSWVEGTAFPPARRLDPAFAHPAAAMSWAAHDLEPYAIQKHLGVKVAFVPLLIGSYSPDILSKWFVYGIDVLGIKLRADDPEQFHRGWPGVGFTHSLGYGVLIAALIWLVFGSRLWAWSFLLGHWAHALTDAGDTIGTMLVLPVLDRDVRDRRLGLRRPVRAAHRRRRLLQRARVRLGRRLRRVRADLVADAQARVLP